MKTIKVNARTYRKFLKARAIAESAKRKAESFLTKLNLPNAGTKTVGEYVLANAKNKKPVGKLTIFKRAPFPMPETFISRVS